MKYFLAFAVALTMLSSCVSSRKHNQLKDDNAKLNAQYRDSVSNLRDMRKAYNGQRKENDKLSKDFSDIKHRFDEMSTSYDQSQKLNKNLQELYEKLLAQKKELGEKAANDVIELSRKQTELQAQLDAKENALRQMESDVRRRQDATTLLEKELRDRETRINSLQGDKSGLEKNLADREKRVKELEDNLADREKRVKELEDILNAQKAQASALKDKLKNALKAFSSSELTVEEKNGKVYVSLSQQLLFASGSKSLDKKGKEALAKLAEVLNKNTETQITVEGHTDSDGDDNTNWDLSVGRATSIIFELTKNSVDPKRITASGRGEFYPIAPNTNTEGKAKNRRSEIILSPDLSELYDLINKD